MATFYARLLNRYEIKYQTVFLARFKKQDEVNQVLDEIEIFKNLKINQNTTESDIENIDNRYSLENQIQKQEKNSDWRLDKIS